MTHFHLLIIVGWIELVIQFRFIDRKWRISRCRTWGCPLGACYHRPSPSRWRWSLRLWWPRNVMWNQKKPCPKWMLHWMGQWGMCPRRQALWQFDMRNMIILYLRLYLDVPCTFSEKTKWWVLLFLCLFDAEPKVKNWIWVKIRDLQKGTTTFGHSRTYHPTCFVHLYYTYPITEKMGSHTWHHENEYPMGI